ncbi:MAG: hypothetical protein ACJAW3_000659, partial [Lentimonas sp.]
LFALGIYIGREKHEIVNSLRSIAIALCNILLPLVLAIDILFMISLLFVGTEPLFKTGSTTILLITLVSVTIFFINGIFQDGTRERPSNRYLTIATNISIFTLPIYSAIALYAIYLRIDQYGLTPDRFLILITTLIISLYSLSYSYCVCIKGKIWLGNLRTVNTILSIIVFAVILMINTPALNANKYSAINQYNRLISGKVEADKFDYGYLNYKLGKYGKEYVEKLKSLENHNQIEIIKKRLDLLKTSKFYNKHRWNSEIKTNQMTYEYNVESVHENKIISSKLLEFLKNNRKFKSECSGKKTCLILFANLDNDEEDEAIFTDGGGYGYATIIDKDSENKWQKVGYLKRPSGLKIYNSKSDLKRKVKESKYKTINNKYKSLQIGNNILYFYER